MSGELRSVLEDGPIEGEPLVSVCVITYNHGKYIRQCLDGILMQKVNFPYEILIHDDASPDDTADIIREYWEKYPTVIKPILQTENQYSQGRDVSRFNIDRAKAKYIAQCEGDDYWTYDGKLQIQVDFLEEHGEYVGTAHNVRVVDENGVVTRDCLPYPRFQKNIFTFSDVELFRLPGQTASLVYRNIYHGLSCDMMSAYYKLLGVGDRKLALLLTLQGDIYCFENILSSYRLVLTGTSWSAQNYNKFGGVAVIQWIQDWHNFTKEYFKREFNPFGYVGSLYLIIFLRVFKYRKREQISDLVSAVRIVNENHNFRSELIKSIVLHPNKIVMCFMESIL